MNILTEVLGELGHADKDVYALRYRAAKEAAVRVLYDAEKNTFINSKDAYQYSVHSAVWMILGGACVGKNAKEMLLGALASEDSIKPFTPYMHHYVVEALIKVGLLDKAEAYIKNYWGNMVKLGADAFYEVYVPNDLDFSPYNDRKINSMCHAWSCTPSYFIRKYFDK